MEERPSPLPSIVIFDQSVSAQSPAGSCVLTEVVGLAEVFQVTVVSTKCDAANYPGVRFVKIPLPTGPVILRYVCFQILAPFYAFFLRYPGSGAAIGISQTTQGQYVGADIAYAHFCHRAYLCGAWKTSPSRGLRRGARWLNHRFNAFFERRAFLRARTIVAPSEGLACELANVYPFLANRIVTLPNPVDVAHFVAGADFDRAAYRSALGIADSDTVFIFVALGDFARKGLGLVLEAFAKLVPQLQNNAQLLVVGGRPNESVHFLKRAVRLNIVNRIRFAGLQNDIAPFLWASNLLVMPSSYEIFSLAMLQGAAAGLPLIVSEGMYGADEFVVNGLNGWVVPRTVEGVQSAMEAALLDTEALENMGAESRKSVQKYSKEVFVQRWRALYAELLMIDSDLRVDG